MSVSVLKKSVAVFILLVAGYLFYRAYYTGNYHYVRQELISDLTLFSESYIKDPKDRAEFNACIRRIDEISQKYGK